MQTLTNDKYELPKSLKYITLCFSMHKLIINMSLHLRYAKQITDTQHTNNKNKIVIIHLNVQGNVSNDG